MIFDKVELIPLQPLHARLREKALRELKHDPFSKYIGDNIKDISNNVTWLNDAVKKNLHGSSLKHYGIFSADKETFIGEIGIDAFDEAEGVANVFYWVRPGSRNRGIARQAIELLKVEAASYNIQYFKFIIDKSNFLSERVIRKVGASRNLVLNGSVETGDPHRYYYFLELQGEEDKIGKIAL
ncbi:GNAT family N-acetyltransferase [Desertivirga arenae]|uniref:GNAT family N-acetyltransferase n=1 Tax=Desertivirga arenae TaxID=2810309 RepID=UPI001A97BF0B|nr:GNAT family N-acetyltransferase [Pedobacter sp. SYSU D00823]